MPHSETSHSCYSENQGYGSNLKFQYFLCASQKRKTVTNAHVQRIPSFKGLIVKHLKDLDVLNILCILG